MTEKINPFPAQPIAVFMSGDHCFVVQEEPIDKRGIQYSRLTLTIPQSIRMRYKIRKEEIDYTYDPEGVIYREYPRHRIVILSPNPTNPVWLIACDFNGNFADDKLSQIPALKNLVDENYKLAQTVKSLRAANKKLDSEILRIANNYAEFRKRFAPLFEDKGELAQKMLEAMRPRGTVQ